LVRAGSIPVAPTISNVEPLTSRANWRLVGQALALDPVQCPAGAVVIVPFLFARYIIT